MDLTGYTKFSTRLPNAGSRISLFLPGNNPNSFDEYVGTVSESSISKVDFMANQPVYLTFKNIYGMRKEESPYRTFDIRNRNAIWRHLDAGASTPYVLDGGRKYRKRKQTKRKSRKTKRS